MNENAKNMVKYYTPLINYCKNKKSIAVIGALNYEMQLEHTIFNMLKKKYPNKTIHGYDKQKHETTIYANFEDWTDYCPREYDTIIISGMLDHCLNIKQVLKNCKNLMHKKSTLIIEGDTGITSQIIVKNLWIKKSILGDREKGEHLITLLPENIRRIAKHEKLKITKEYYYGGFYPTIKSQIRRFLDAYNEEWKGGYIFYLKQN